MHFCVMRVILRVTNVRESKTVLDSGFHAMYSGFRIPDTLSVEIGSRIPKPRISDSTGTTCWIPNSRSKSGPGINATQASQTHSFASTTGRKQKKLKRKDVHRCDKHKHKQKIRHTDAKVSNFDDTAVGAKEFITGIQSKIRLWWEKRGSVTSAMVLTFMVMLVSCRFINRHNIYTTTNINKRTAN